MLRFPGDGWSQPARVVLDATLGTRRPRYAWATSRTGASASGSGLAADSLVRTLGEYFERRHFYHEVRGQARGTLDACRQNEPGESLVGDLHHALAQTCQPDRLSLLRQHAFRLSPVVRLPEWRAVSAPTVLFSVGGPGLEDDSAYLPNRDTTGCAAHFDLARALQGAMREFVERQYLLRYWLVGAGGRDVTPAALAGLCPLGTLLAQHLAQRGELRFIELSLGEVAAAIVLAVYRGEPDGPVRYCVGLSCTADIGSAADRALRELWQSHVFLTNMAEPGAEALVHDRYHRYFIECNTMDTARELLAGAPYADAEANGSLGAPEAGTCSPSDEAFAASVHRRFGPLLAYIAQTTVLHRRIWCVRVLSPRAFLHLDNASHFNLDCAFSRDFAALIRPERLTRMVPFP